MDNYTFLDKEYKDTLHTVIYNREKVKTLKCPTIDRLVNV